MIDTSHLEVLEDKFEAQEFRPTSKYTSRPRSKLTGKNRANASGTVLESHRGRYIVSVEGSEITAARARKLRDFDIVPGDKVEVVLPKDMSPKNVLEEDLLKNNSDLARIETVKERKNLIKRTADDTKTVTKSIAANVDQVAIVTSTTSPDIQPQFIVRVLTEARENKAVPYIFVTKSDLQALDFEKLPSETKGIPLLDAHEDYQQILNALRGGSTVLIGLSGAGKSTLINRIFPQALRATAEVSENGDGRHTSTSSKGILLEHGGLVIDTPGIRSFGLGHLKKA